MQSGRPIVAAVGLFFGGLIVGSNPGVTREGNAAHASESPPPTQQQPRTRGPVAPALHRLMGASVSSRVDAETEAPKWSSARREHHVADPGDPDDPLDGLKMPELPVPRTPEVLKYVRYFSESYEGRKIFSEGLRRSGRYHEIIVKTFRELGLPKDLIAVAFIESGFNVEAVSTAGASGMWQFMPATARAYGLVVENDIDERSGIWASTDAAAHHLSDLYARFRSWELALAAYNLGYDALDRRMDDMEADDFWTLADTPGGLPDETKHYVPKVLGAAIVFANLEKLGFGDVELAPELDAAELDVPPETKLALVARAAGTSVRVLRELNPELLGDMVPDRSGRALVHVPKSGASRARAMLPKLSTDDPDTLRVSEDFDWGRDDAKSGHSRLERTAAIREPHRRRRHHAAAPERETRAAKTEEEPRVAKRDSDSDDTEDKPVKKREPAKKEDDEPNLTPADPPAVVERTPPPPKAATTRVLYRVVAGDSLAQIAATVGLTVDQVLAQAHVISASQIQVGQLLDLRVPAKGIDP